MLIIDLKNSNDVKKSPKEPDIVLLKKSVTKLALIQPKSESLPLPLAPIHYAETDEKGRLLRQLADEDARVRIDRAKLHTKYFELLTPDLLPKPGADFSVIYEQMDDYQNQLQAIWIKRQQVEKYGTLKSTDPVSNAQLTQLSALKHTRSNAYKNLGKWEKKLAEATGKNSTQAITNAQAKINEIELNILDLSHQINELNERVKTAR